MANTSVDPAQALFETIAESACTELFAAYGVSLSKTSAPATPSPEFLVCGVIGFSGKNVRGTLVVALTEDVLGKSNPLPGQAQPRDWIAELSNQLLGRIKTQLLRSGIEIYLNLPAVLRGEHLAPLPRKELNPVRFSGESGAVGVWVEVEASPNFRVSGEGGPETAGPSSGDTLLF